jgi:hypothetical protein
VANLMVSSRPPAEIKFEEKVLSKDYKLFRKRK